MMKENNLYGDKKLKLCFIGWGISRHMANWLGWYTKQGHRIMLITNYPGTIDGVENVDISRKSDNRPRYIRYREGNFNWGWLNYLKTFFRIKKLVEDFKPDVLHLHTLFYPAYLGAFIGYTPLVVLPWNGDILWEYKKNFILRWIVRRTLRRADLILYHSEEMRKACLKYMNEQGRLINWHGADFEHFNTYTYSENELRERYDLGTAQVVYSSRGLGDFYNIDIIVKSVPIVLKHNPEVRFIFTWPKGSGTAEQISILKSIATELKVIDKVIFLGSLPWSDIPSLHRLADVIVSIPSKDAIPNTLLEAMICKAVPVVGDLPQVRELVQDGINGFIVPCRDKSAVAKAIIKALDDRDLRDKIISNNLDRVNKYGDVNQKMALIEKKYYKLSKEKRKRFE